MRPLLRRLLAAQGRPAGAVLALLLALLLLATESRPELALRLGLFDSWQRLQPRERVNDGVVVVEIDEQSLNELGQWPWPRTRVAQLIWQLAAQRPAAIGIDLLFPEPDRYSPRRLAQQMPELRLAPETVAELPDSDEELASALRRAPVVLGVGASDPQPLLEGPTRDPRQRLPHYGLAVRSTAVLDRAARAHGVIARVPDRGVVRRLPTLAVAGDRLLPGLALESLRVAAGRPPLRLRSDARGLVHLRFGDYRIPTDRAGGWWLHFSDWTQRPHLSAAAVLRGELPPGTLTDRIVLLGYTALGLQDTADTPLGPMPGLHVHAEAIDNLIDGRLLSRPPWAPLAETALLLLLAGVAIVFVPTRQAAGSGALYAGLALAALAAATAAFWQLGWLLDAVSPLLAAAAVFAFMSTVALNEAQAQRRRLRAALVSSRESQMRLEAELDAARRIQIGMLPQPAEVLAQESRVSIAARMQAARTVGGDLYDFFLLDRQHLLFLIGDVSGKGLPASLFMALLKAAIKGVAQRVEPDPAQMLSETGSALAENNPEQLFVTMLGGLLDLDSGKLLWSSAGHDAPYLLPANGGPPQRLHGVGGPPLCVLDAFHYPLERLPLRPGDRLCLITDGITEAQNSDGELYGAPRLLAALQRSAALDSLEDQADALLADVAAFVGNAEPADDAALLLLRWNGRT